MTNIIFPLKPQMRGPEVADLQDALRQLLERSAILGDDEGARRELAAALKREREGETFGDATRKLVGIFQKARRIEVSGAIDAATADAPQSAAAALVHLERGVMRSRGGDMARLRCPKCPPFMEAPTFRCIACGTGWWDDPEEVRDG